MTRELRGIHVLIITLAAFGTIIAVNLALAFSAIATFPGVETRSAYVASQHFQAERAAQQALRWTVDLTAQDGALRLSITDGQGQGVQPQQLDLVLRRPTTQASDHHPRLEPEGPGRWRADILLAPGHWNADLTALAADGTAFRQRLPMRVGD